MSTFTRFWILLLFTVTTLLAGAPAAAVPGMLTVPSFDALAKKATESVNISLDSSLLGLAAGFLDPASPEDAAAKEVIAGLKGIYVTSYRFAEDFAYPSAEIDSVRRQL